MRVGQGTGALTLTVWGGWAAVDVFVSWTRADADDGPRRLAAALEDVGLGVWFDEERIEPFASIPDRVRAGLGEAKVLVAWYSAAYATRRACREELTLALLAAERAGEGPDRVLVVNPEPNMGHVLEARLLDRRFAGRDEITHLAALAKVIADRARQVSGPLGAIPAMQPTRWYGGEGWQGGSVRFVGRQNMLWAIHDRLQRTTGLAGPGAAGRGVALVSGLGGVGKSLLAAEYAHLFASCYPGGVVWLSAQGNDTGGRALSPGQGRAAAHAAIAQVAVSAMDLDVTGLDPPAVKESVKSALERRGEMTLWVIDDVPSGISAADLDAWRCPAPLVAELLTSREATEGRLDRIALDVLDPADALALLSGGRPLDVGEREQAALLAAELGYHPLACDVAGLYVRSSTSFAAYRRLIAGGLENFDALAAELSGQLPGDHARQITATLATSLNELRSQAWQLLRLAAQLAPVAIPEGLIAAVFARLANGADSPDPVPGEREANRALHDAHGDGLWRFDPDTRNVDVHVLVRQAATILDPHPGQQPTTLTAAIIALTAALAAAADDTRRHPTIALEAQHARHVASTAPPSDLTADALDLLNWLAVYDARAGRYASARDLNQRTYNTRRRVLGEDHPDTLDSANNLATTLQDLGDLAGARDLNQRTYDISRRVLGEDHPDTLTSANNLADALRALSDLVGARDLNQHIYDTRRRVLGEDHPDTLTSASNLAVTLADLGDLAGARDLQGYTYDTGRRVLGEDHPDTLTTASNLATTLQDLGDLAAARDLHQHTYDTRRRVLGEDHPNTLGSANNLARTLQDLGDLAGARDLHQHTYDTFRRVLGEDHPDTLTSANNLATTLQDLGDLAAARDLHQHTYETSRRVLGEDHPGTVTSANNLAGALLALDDFAGARDLLQHTYDTFRRVLGEDHADTLITASNLAGALLALGDLAGARDLLQRIYDARRRALGENHPDTLTTSSNLATTLHDLGDLVGARDLLQHTYDARRRILGENHSDTLDSAIGLASTLLDLDDLTKARDLLQHTYDASRRVLGEDHPDTLTTANGLATTLHDLGDLAGARDLLQRIYDTSRRVLGEDHPDTLDTANYLAATLYELGDRGAAIALLSQVVQRRSHQAPSLPAERAVLKRWRRQSERSARWKKAAGWVAYHRSSRHG
jgi:tetratricopeptide (TPR) repeat protein